MPNPFFNNPPLVAVLRSSRLASNGEDVESLTTEDTRVFLRYQSDGSYTTEIKNLGKFMAANCYVKFGAYADSANGASVSLQIRTSVDNVAWSDWRTFNDGELLRFWSAQWRVVFHADDFYYRPYVSQLQIIIDVPDVYKAGDFDVPVGGAEVFYGYDFFVLPYVVASARGADRRASIQSKAKNSFIVKVLDESGTDVGGVGDWHAKGY